MGQNRVIPAPGVGEGSGLPEGFLQTRSSLVPGRVGEVGLARQNQEVTTIIIFATIEVEVLNECRFFFLANEILLIYNITYPTIWPYFLVPRNVKFRGTQLSLNS